MGELKRIRIRTRTRTRIRSKGKSLGIGDPPGNGFTRDPLYRINLDGKLIIGLTMNSKDLGVRLPQVEVLKYPHSLVMIINYG